MPLRAGRICGLLSLPVLLLAGCSLDGLVFDLPPGGGGASSSSGSGASNASSGGGGATTTTPTGPETCENGLDDDADGKTDCDDEECMTAEHTCLDAAPVGWSGPSLLFEADLAVPLDDCPSAYPTLQYEIPSGLSFEPALCGKCACTAAVPTCEVQGFSAHTGASCNGSIAVNPQPVAGAMCGTVTVDSAGSFKAPPPVLSVAGCKPTGDATALGPASWSKLGRMCAATSLGTCAAGGVCAPAAPVGSSGKLCIWQGANLECPSGYPDRHLLGEDTALADDRGCSPCACPSTVSCAAVIHLYGDAACTTEVLGLAADDLCAQNPGKPSVKSYMPTYAVRGSCEPVGGEPTGTVEPAQPVTVCCVP